VLNIKGEVLCILYRKVIPMFLSVIFVKNRIMKHTLTLFSLLLFTSLLQAQDTQVRISLFEETRFNNGQSGADGLIIILSPGGNNGVDAFDAPKFFNIDESFARQNGSNFISIERRDIPVDNEQLLFYNITYRSQDYIFLVEAFQLADFQSYFKDTYTGIVHEVGNGADVVIPFSVDNNIPGSLDVNRFELSFIEKADYTFDGVWTTLDPCMTAITATDNLNVISGNAIIDCDIELKNLTISAGATLEIANGRTVTVNGDILNLGNIVAEDATFKINNDNSFFSNNTQLENLTITDSSNVELTGTVNIYGVLEHSGTGNAIVDNENAVLTLKSTIDRNAYFLPTDLQLSSSVISESYMSAKRAFRFVSSPVTTTSNIFENWQENGDETIVGLGIDITGTAGASAGFDITPSNSPSMYRWDNPGQAWVAQTSTNAPSDVINNGVPYRLFVRGDRQVDLTSNVNAQRETVIRTNGVLHAGDFTSITSNIDGSFNMIGNPYAAPYDLDGMLSNLNVSGNPIDALGTRSTFFYVWDPTLQSRGAYVTYDTSLDLSFNPSSEVNGFLQPYQAAFVIANGAAGDFTFKESYLDINQSHVQVSSVPTIMNIKLLKNQIVKDGVIIKFSPNYSNNVDNGDAPKLQNIEENLSVLESQSQISIAARNSPVHGEIIPLNIEQLTNGVHQLSISPVLFQNVDAYLKDNFTGHSVLLNQSTTTDYSFDFDNGNPQSSDASRFQIEFMNSTLSIDDIAFTEAISLYPNPSQDGIITIQKPSDVNLESIVVFNTLGQKLKQIKPKASNQTVDMSSFSNGIYLLQLTMNGITVSKKVILE